MRLRVYVLELLVRSSVPRWRVDSTPGGSRPTMQPAMVRGRARPLRSVHKLINHESIRPPRKNSEVFVITMKFFAGCAAKTVGELQFRF
jgi:hypothetical protein